MGKLLDFKAPERPAIPAKDEVSRLYDQATFEDVKDCLDQDRWCGLTPDMPELRFKGPQLVFLWDQNKDRQFFDDNHLERGKDYVIKHWNAHTVRSYIPFRNNSGAIGTLPFYAMKSVNWPDLMVEDQVSQLLRDPMQISGRVMSVSLKALIELDQYYSNGFATTRHRIPVTTGMQTNTPDVSCWMYFSSLRSLCKYDPHSQKYSMQRGITIGNCPAMMNGHTRRYDLSYHHFQTTRRAS